MEESAAAAQKSIQEIRRAHEMQCQQETLVRHLKILFMTKNWGLYNYLSLGLEEWAYDYDEETEERRLLKGIKKIITSVVDNPNMAQYRISMFVDNLGIDSFGNTTLLKKIDDYLTNSLHG